MKPNLIAKRSAWSIGSTIFWCIILCWLVVPIFILIFKILSVKSEEIQLFDNKIVVKKGLLSKSERQSAFTKIMSVSVEQTLWGRMMNYGNIKVDVVGKWDVNLSHISKPNELKGYLENIISNTNYQNLTQVVSN